MKIDIDIIAIITAVITFISSYGMMKATLRYLEKSVEEIKKDFKGMGAKLGRIDSEVTYIKGALDAKHDLKP